MEYLRCKCGKILCQLEDETVIIKCRHCKRLANIEFAAKQDNQKTGEVKDRQPKIEFT